MLPLRCGFAEKIVLWLLFSLVANFTWAQSETATVSGQVVDPSGLNVTGAQVKLVDIDRDTSTSTTTNNSGLYTFPSVRPGRYRMAVTAAGFKVVDVTGVTVNVQDHLEQNFKLVVGSMSESITVEGGVPLVDTESATVSTLVDRNFAENLPMNGRSFQTLIELTPGVVLTSSNGYDSGQFSVNGQRAASNYWMVDGVSANIGIGVNAGGLPGNGLGGTVGSFSAQGGTNSLVSVDAMQEFRVQTSTYAPEFGRTPGGQISIVTRSGTNQFHGTTFDYLRNSVLDASDWFADQQGLPKPEERQNDFGGVLGGPIIKDRTFFFFSYEGQRLRLPQVALTDVPDLNARQTALPALQPFLNAFPLPSPNTPDNVAEGIGQFNASYSNKSSLDAYSLRIDHSLRNDLSLFGRYNDSPSEIVQRGPSSTPLSTVSNTRISTQTATAGATWLSSPNVTLDLRFNYSRVNAFGYYYLDNFGGAVPLAALPFPSPFTSQDGHLLFDISSLIQGGELEAGPVNRNLQRQINIVNSLALQKGSHSLKFGVDFRRLTPLFEPAAYLQDAVFSDVPSAENGILSYSIVVGTGASPTFLFRNLGLYAQDTWRIVPRLTVTYGLRWDIDFVPQSLSGSSFPAVTGFNLDNLSNLALAPPGTQPYSTTYGNIAPRFGIAYQLLQSQGWQAVLRGGFGVFYDLASSEAGNSIGIGAYPFGNEAVGSGTFPLSSPSPPPIVAPSPSNPGELFAFDPKFKLPYTLQWNVALEQALGQKQTISVSYIGAAGRRLIQTAFVVSPTPAFTYAQLVTNAATSNYNAGQVQFQRRLAHGLQALASYTWSHSIDTASAGSAFGSFSNILSLENENRGPSDFDIRNTLSAGVTYEIPVRRVNSFAGAILGGWSTENFIVARSSPPLSVFDEGFYEFNNAFSAAVWPDLVPGKPLYLYGAQCSDVLEPLEPNSQEHFGCPGGKGLNPAAFTDPPFGANGNPLRQGTLGRNALRAFGATQWDLAIHRDFPLHESVKLQFRAEMFNVLNHPNFGPPNGSFLSPQFGGPVPGFGVANQMLGQSLSSSNQGGGGFSALYQIGGPRSIQFALKLSF
jgi:hypothetical protein